MQTPFYTRFVLLDRERDRRSSSKTLQEPPKPSDHGLVCAACRHLITDEDHWIEVNGAHEHTFVNPAGFMYVVGCWRAAPGCAWTGSTETAFSWFPGWSWQVAACARCRAHLGWCYRSPGEQFHGLITAALRARE